MDISNEEGAEGNEDGHEGRRGARDNEGTLSSGETWKRVCGKGKGEKNEAKKEKEKKIIIIPELICISSVYPSKVGWLVGGLIGARRLRLFRINLSD